MNTDKFLADLHAAFSKGQLSQNKICKQIGISQGALSKLVNGKNRLIRLETAIALWPFVYGQPFPGRDRA